MNEINYKALLKRYIVAIINSEGTTFFNSMEPDDEKALEELLAGEET